MPGPTPVRSLLADVTGHREGPGGVVHEQERLGDPGVGLQRVALRADVGELRTGASSNRRIAASTRAGPDLEAAQVAQASPG